MIVLIITYVLNKVSISWFLGTTPEMMTSLKILSWIDVLYHLWTSFSHLFWLKWLIYSVHWIEILELIPGLMEVDKLYCRLLNVIRCKLRWRRASIMDYALVWYSDRLRNIVRVWSRALRVEMLCLFLIWMALVLSDVWICVVILILVFYLSFGDLNVLFLIRECA